MAMLETVKLTEYIVEPLGSLAEAIVCEMFWSLRRLTVTLPVGVIWTLCGVFTTLLSVFVIVVVVVLVVGLVIVEVLVSVVVLGSATRRLIEL